MNVHKLESNFTEWPDAKELSDAYMKVRDDCLTEMIRFGVHEENLEVHPWKIVDSVSGIGYVFQLTSMQTFGEIVVKFIGTPFIKQ